jgi:hypothetical protein
MSKALQATIGIFLLAIFATSAFAEKEEEAKRAFIRGAEAYQAGQPRQALRHYRKSYRLVERPRTLYNIAICEQDLGQHGEAFLHFDSFLQQAEERDADLVAEARERLRKSAAHLPTGTLTLESTPSGASVFVDSEVSARGMTPSTFKLPPGPHTIRVEQSGAMPVTREVRVLPGKEVHEAVALVTLSSIEVTTTPVDATIRPVQRPTDAAKGRLAMDVLAGTHEFQVSRRGYRTQNVRITVATGAIQKKHVTLLPVESSTLRVSSNVAGAVLSVDGRVAGPIPIDSNGRIELNQIIKPGSHVVSLEYKGYSPWSERVDVEQGQRVVIQVELKQGSSGLSYGVLGLGGLGLASLAAGATYGILALKDDRNMVGPRTDRRALTADILYAGAAVALGGAYLLHRFNRSERESRGFVQKSK